MIATYIQELLATNNRVIVPNYGAFLVRATSKSKDANTLDEKLKDIYFSPFLKFNDELLEKYIIQKEGISKDQAAEKITQFINDIKKDLEQDKPYEIKGFGSFTADKQGKVQFLTIVKDVPAKTDKKEEPSKTTVKKAATTKKPAVEKKVEPKTEEKVEVKKEEPKLIAKDETKLEEFKPEKKEETKIEQTKTEPVQKATFSYKKEKKSMNKGLVWSIAIGLPLAAIFIWALLNFNTVKKVFDKKSTKTEQVSKKKKETPTKKADTKTAEVKNEAKDEAAKPVEKKAEIQKPVVAQKKYYIIAGSFKNEKYAISYMNKLKADGYNAEKLAERNGMHAISYSSFDDKRKAIAEYKFLAQEKGLQTWILYY